MRKSKFQMLRSGLSVLVLSAALIIGLTGCKNPSNGSETPGTPEPEQPSATITYTVTFVTNGGTPVNSQEIKKGKTVTKPANPTKTNDNGYSYTFADWYSNSSLTNVFDFATPINADITLYAKWTKTYVGFTEEEVSKSFSGTAYRELESGTDGSAGTTATYVLFGDWPQSAKTENVSIYESITITQGAHTYYKGNDNYWYAKVDTKYYKVEPIKWRILDSTKKLLLAEKVLEIGDYNTGDALTKRTLEGVEINHNNYEYSRVRAYLNGINYYSMTNGNTEQIDSYKGKGFLQTAFTSNLQNSIADTEIDNSAASTFPDGSTGTNTAACSDTTDKIFLLSKQEVTKSAYGFTSDSNRKYYATDYVSDTYGENNIDEGPAWPWWLRSPYDDNQEEISFWYIDGAGSTKNHIETPAICGNGIVPALCIK